MSDTLSLVVDVPKRQPAMEVESPVGNDKLKRIGHSLSHSDDVESP